MYKICEADKKRFSTSRERATKKMLIDLLRDDGKGHHHSKYADYLSRFDLRIIYNDPDVTAYMDFENGVIGISDGFLQDKSYFYQLNVLLRHELAHALLKHQIRMMYKISSKYGEKGASRIEMSSSLHNLDNIIADYEISNTRYTAEDKETVRNMMLNGRLISGLVTEDHRKNWVNLSVEDMYDALTDEIEAIQQNLLDGYSYRINKNDFINREILSAASQYKDIDSISKFDEPLDKFMARPEFKQILEPLQEIISSIYNEFGTRTVDTQFITQILEQISKSNIREVVEVLNEDGEVVCSLYTPEEKFFAVESLKAVSGNNTWQKQYEIWYQKVLKLLSDPKFDADDVQNLLDAMNN